MPSELNDPQFHYTISLSIICSCRIIACIVALYRTSLFLFITSFFRSLSMKQAAYSVLAHRHRLVVLVNWLFPFITKILFTNYGYLWFNAITYPEYWPINSNVIRWFGRRSDSQVELLAWTVTYISWIMTNQVTYPNLGWEWTGRWCWEDVFSLDYSLRLDA